MQIITIILGYPPEAEAKTLLSKMYMLGLQDIEK